MIDFDCFDGIEDFINKANSSQQRGRTEPINLNTVVKGEQANLKCDKVPPPLQPPPQPQPQPRSSITPENVTEKHKPSHEPVYYLATNLDCRITQRHITIDTTSATIKPNQLLPSKSQSNSTSSSSSPSNSLSPSKTAIAIKTTTSKSCDRTDMNIDESNRTPSPTKSAPSVDTHPANNETWRRDNNLLSCLLITANVGTIFEESTLLELWFQQLKEYLVKIKPSLVAIHCQEVGGKNFESSMKNVSTFTDKILGDNEIIDKYSRVRIFLDENFECLEKFTALGSLYLIHDSVEDVKLYNFKTAQYDSIQDRVIFKDNNNNFKRDGQSISTITTNNIKEQQQQQNQLEQQQQSHQQINETTCPIKSNENNNNNVVVDVKKIATNNQQPYATCLSGSCNNVEKIKFPQELFPECRWSRKGFMRTRWLFDDTQLLDLVNIHLFHDASNLVAMKTTPSPYAQNRQKALQFALEYLEKPLSGQVAEQVPLFIFGDFNFRLDTNRVIQRITEGVDPIVKRNNESDEVVEFIYHQKAGTSPTSMAADNVGVGDQSESSKVDENISQSGNQTEESGISSKINENVVMTVGKKLFDFKNLDEMFRATKNTEWLQELDIELDSFKDRLFEFKISFSPSYPFKEDESGGYSYMKTRCPAWCDRILFNSAGNDLIFCRNQSETTGGQCLASEKKIELLQEQGDVIYRLMGNSVPMGDHKPVLLYCQLDLSEHRRQMS